MINSIEIPQINIKNNLHCFDYVRNGDKFIYSDFPDLMKDNMDLKNIYSIINVSKDGFTICNLLGESRFISKEILKEDNYWTLICFNDYHRKLLQWG